MKHFFKYFGLVVIAVACGRDEFKPADIGLDYFPLKKGVFRIYQINETRYTEVAPPEIISYQLKEEVVDSFPSGANGIYSYVIHRSTRPDAGSEWTPSSTWSARITDRELIVNEGNISFVKLIFPAKTGNTWNGNKYNTLDSDDYKLISFDTPFTVSGMTFEKTLTVEQENNDEFIVFLDQRKEVYARGAGLVYREVKQLNYCIADHCLGQEKVENGLDYKQQILEYGVQ